MIDKPLNQLNAFFNLTQERTISGSDQLLYLHLFNRFNRAHWAQSIRISDRELITAMRLYESSGKPAGVNTLYRSRSRLKSAGLIDFKSGKGADATEYELIQLYPADTPANTPADTPVDTLPPSHINNAREDVKTKDVKTNLTTTAATAHVRENGWNSIEVQETWFRFEGEQIPRKFTYKLHELEQLYGTEAVCKALAEAIPNNKEPQMTTNYIEGVLKNQLKGGTKNGRTSNVVGIDNAQYSGIDEF